MQYPSGWVERIEADRRTERIALWGTIATRDYRREVAVRLRESGTLNFLLKKSERVNA